MPGYDKTGPQGQGPMTGRGMGRCRNNGDVPANEERIDGESTTLLGLGRGGRPRGGGMGRCRGGRGGGRGMGGGGGRGRGRGGR